MTFPVTQVLINGNYVAAQEARVSVDERGFRFGDGVFETIAVHDGIPYLWEYHMERLQGGLEALRIPCHSEGLRDQALGLIRANGQQQCLIRISVSRGVGSKGYLPQPVCGTPTIVIQTLEMPLPPKEPVSLWLSGYEKISPRALPVRYKLAQGVNPTLARLEASDHQCHEALQLNAQGYMAEASAANIFWLEEGTLYTPSLECGGLSGVTRRRLMELSPYPVREGTFFPIALENAQEVMLTNASLGVVSVKTLLPVGYRWSATRAAKALSERLGEDRIKYAASSRELLA